MTTVSGLRSSALQGFAGQAVLALELAEARRDAERISVFEGPRSNCPRSARFRHPATLRSWHEVGIGIAPSRESDVEKRIHDVVDDLDVTIRDIRSTIYSLPDYPAR